MIVYLTQKSQNTQKLSGYNTSRDVARYVSTFIIICDFCMKRKTLSSVKQIKN